VKLVACLLTVALAAAQMHPFPGPGTHGVGGGGGGGPFTDDFTRSNGGLGGNWTTITGLNAMQIDTLAASGTVIGDSSGAYWSANALGTDHYAQVSIDRSSGAEGLGPCVRVDTSTMSGYCWYANGMGATSRDLYRIVSGTFTLLSSSTSGANTNGDVLKLVVSGTGATVTISCYRNGSLDTSIGTSGVVSDTDATRLTGGTHAGIVADGNSNAVDNFVCNSGS